MSDVPGEMFSGLISGFANDYEGEIIATGISIRAGDPALVLHQDKADRIEIEGDVCQAASIVRQDALSFA